MLNQNNKLNRAITSVSTNAKDVGAGFRNTRRASSVDIQHSHTFDFLMNR